MERIYYIYLNKDVEKTLQKIPKKIRLKIELVIDGLETDPYLGVKMNADLDHLHKIKIGNYRIIYRIYESEIMIEIKEIQSRGNMSYDR